MITTDDQTLASMSERTMPFTSRFYAERGTELTNAVVVSPSCCPARAAFLTGQYPHNNGVFANTPGYTDLRGKRNTLPVWLQRAGYRTAHVGKFLNRYGGTNGWKTPAPGFGTWYTQINYRYYDYRIATRGKVKAFGAEPRDYVTRRLNGRSVRFLRRNAARTRPLYLQLDHFAPHSETGESGGRCTGAAQPDPLDLELFADEPLPQEDLDPAERSFNEEDVSDKSPVIATRRHLSDFVLGKVARRYRCQLASLRAVDRGFERIVRTLIEVGALRRTAIVFTSDNGFFHGEHRLPNNKGFPYEEGIRVPLLVRLPPGLAGAPPPTLEATVSNIDITATLLELAGGEPCNGAGRCRRLDGRSFLGLLDGSGAGWPEPRRILIEQDRGQFLCAPYAALWTARTLLTEYPTPNEGGECVPEYEHYEMDADPMQLDNLFPAAPGTPYGNRQAHLLAGLEELRRCSGIEGRDRGRPDRPFCE